MAISSKPNNALGDLVQGVLDANGWSIKDVERRITARGDVRPMSDANIGRLMKDYPLASVTREATIALAAGLGISPDRVALAAVEAMGFRAPAGQVTAAEAVLRDESLSDDTRRAVLAVLRSSSVRAV